MSEQLTLIAAAVTQRDRIIAAFQENHRDYLDSLRGVARDLCKAKGEVAIDDLRAVLSKYDIPFPAELGIDERVFGAVFKTKEFIPIAQRLTHREVRVARAGRVSSMVTVYKLASLASKAA